MTLFQTCTVYLDVVEELDSGDDGGSYVGGLGLMAPLGPRGTLGYNGRESVVLRSWQVRSNLAEQVSSEPVTKIQY